MHLGRVKQLFGRPFLPKASEPALSGVVLASVDTFFAFRMGLGCACSLLRHAVWDIADVNVPEMKGTGLTLSASLSMKIYTCTRYKLSRCSYRADI